MVSCGDFHTLALDFQGGVWTWLGGGDMHNKGQCGHGSSYALEKATKL